ncbi:MAG: AAA family ATPase [Acidimicrobiales bacterium]
MLVLLGGYVAVLANSKPHVTGTTLQFNQFANLVAQGRISDATILDQDSYVVGHYVVHHASGPDGAAAFNTPYLKAADARGQLLNILLAHDVPTTIDQQFGKSLLVPATILLPSLIIVVVFIYLIFSYRRGTGLFGIRSGARRRGRPEAGGVSFSDVAGQDLAVGELRELKAFITDPGRFAVLGARIPRGILLYGPPGCGKTLLARALAAESGAAFYSISGSDFVELYAGVGASRVRDLFREARDHAPAIMFIDELDSVGRARIAGGTASGHGEQEQALNQLLAEMDGFSSTDGVIVVAATNRPDVLDQALLRPGRFDRTIGVERPDEAARLSILAVHASTKAVGPDVDLASVARRAVGMTGADLASVMNEAALLAGRAGRSHVTQPDLDAALGTVLSAPERQRRLSMRERSVGRRFTGDDRVSFADVAGQDAAVARLAEVKDYLTDPDRFAAVGAVAPRGVLLYGPPGCGKTLLARALASEANAAFFSVSASEFVNVFVGAGAARVRDMFAEARSMAPAIVFIDELDGVGRARGDFATFRQSNGEQEQTLNQILSELDGFSPATGVIVVGATNRPDALDPALLRPGRFDRSIGLELPNEVSRLAILELHARSKVLDGEVDLARVAKKAIGLTGADLANVLNEAALAAAQAQRRTVTQGDLDASLGHILKAPGEQRRLALRSSSVARRHASADRVTFADVAGVDDAVDELREVRDYLADPGRYTALGARAPRGVLLSGPPGCGKTLLARAVAGEANAAFFSVAGSEFTEVWVGTGSARVRDVFAEARSMAPAIVFIDELDSIGAARSGAGDSGTREFAQALNQLLVELDGFEATSTVVVMAATNRPEMLDPALVRPGRFDRMVTIVAPNRAGRLAILRLHAAGKALGADVDLDAVAAATRGMSGAELENILNEAALLAARRGLGRISMATVDEGIERATLGLVSHQAVMTDEERRVVAYHEAGHAVVALALPGTMAHKLSILPRGRTLGHCSMVDTHDRFVWSRTRLLDHMAAMLGGWAAERMVFGEAGSGASSDLDWVGVTSRRMVREWGMSETLGPLSFPSTSAAAGGYSEGEGPVIYAESRRLAEEALDRAQVVLDRSRSRLDALVDALLERETMSAAEIEAVVATVPADAANGPVTPRRPVPASASLGPTPSAPAPPAALATATGPRPQRTPSHNGAG